jgi:hypothetical protein
LIFSNYNQYFEGLTMKSLRWGTQYPFFAFLIG